MHESSGGTVKAFVHRYLEMVPQETTAVLAAERMGARRIGCVLVESGDPKRGPIGIVTETDLVRKVLAKGMDPTVTMVDRVMSRPPLTIATECSMLDASHVMEGNQVRHLCVVEGGEIVGVLSVRDLVRSFVDAESGPVIELDALPGIHPRHRHATRQRGAGLARRVGDREGDHSHPALDVAPDGPAAI